MKLQCKDGRVRDIELLDVNIWYAGHHGEGDKTGVWITAYPAVINAEGFYTTDTQVVVFTTATDLTIERWHDDDWFLWDPSDQYRDFPADVEPYVRDAVKELTTE